MKKIKIYNLFLLLTILLISHDVNAIEINETPVWKSYGNKTTQLINIGDTGSATSIGSGYGTNRYQISIGTWLDQPAYCLDPGAAASGYNLKQHDFGVTFEETRIRDAGVAEILKYGLGGSKQGESQNFEFYGKNYSLTDDELYLVTSVAIRAYYIGIFNDSSYSTWSTTASAHVDFALGYLAFIANDPSTTAEQKEDVKYLTQFMTDKPIDDLSNLVNIMKEDFNSTRSWYNPGKTFHSALLNESGSPIWESGGYKYDLYQNNYFTFIIQLLISKGINAALEEARLIEQEKDGSSVTAAPSFVNELGPNVVDETLKQSVVQASLNPTNFESDNYIQKLYITTQVHNIVTMNIDIVKKDESKVTYTSTAAAEEALKHISLDTIKEINFKLVYNIPDGECPPAHFTINYSYNGNVSPSEVLYLSGTGAVQTFAVFLDEGSDTGTDLIDGSLSTQVEICPDMCKNEITVPNYCINPSDIDEDNEWIDQNSTGDFDVKDPFDIVGCITGTPTTTVTGDNVSDTTWSDKLDDGGNSYKNTCETGIIKTESGGSVVNNNYCAVYCKEDYSLKFPAVKNVNNARYFNIDASVYGVKTCYTSEIKIDQYVSDIKTIQTELINQMNIYNKNINTATSLKNDAGTVEICSLFPIPSSKTKYSSSGTYTHYSITFGEYGEATISTSSSEVYPASAGGCSSNTTQTSVAADYETTASAAAIKITSLQNQLNALISDYRACSTWTVNYELNPTLTYTYDSEYYDLSKVEDEMVSTTNTPTTVEKWYCDGALGSNEYNTCSGNLVTNYTAQSKQVKYLSCSTSGCSLPEEYITIGTSNYIKWTMSDNEKYQTERNYYQLVPNGNIVYEATDESIVVDGLPTEMRPTVNGAYTYKINIDNLGEYYSEECDETGRLVDKGDDKSDQSVDDVMEKEDTFTGEYVCYAPINCPECDINIEGNFDTPDPYCPTCKFDVTVNLVYRTYSPDAFNPNNRPLGYNWNYNYTTDTKYGFVSLKAQKTLGITGVDNSGNLIIDENSTGILAEGNAIYAETPFLTVTLDPALVNTIKNYNSSDTVEDQGGGYSNNSLDCQNAKVDGITYKNLLCYSEPLGEWITSDEHKDKFQYGKDADDNQINRDDPSSYWELFVTGIPNQITESTIGGPAWK